MDTGTVAIDIAEDSLARLRRIRKNPQTRWTMARRQFRYAVACTVFSAVSVEVSLKRFIAGRIWFQTRMPERKVLRGTWPERPTVQQMLKFVKSASRIDPELLKDVQELFEHRNRMVHTWVSMEESTEDHPERGPTHSRWLHTHKVGAEDVERAEWCVDVATRARRALGEAYKDPEWKPFER